MGEWFVYACTGLFMILIGLAVRRSKSGWLIAGYNTMPDAEKGKWNLDALKRFVSNLLFFESILLLVFALLQFTGWVSTNVAASICWPVYVCTIVAGIIYVNVSKRFKAQKELT